MSALPPKADMCGATRDVRFGPKADKSALFDHLVGDGKNFPMESSRPKQSRLVMRRLFVRATSIVEQAILFYCAFIQLSDPVTLTDTSEKKIRTGLPSAVPR